MDYRHTIGVRYAMEKLAFLMPEMAMARAAVTRTAQRAPANRIRWDQARYLKARSLAFAEQATNADSLAAMKAQYPLDYSLADKARAILANADAGAAGRERGRRNALRVRDEGKRLMAMHDAYR